MKVLICDPISDISRAELVTFSDVIEDQSQDAEVAIIRSATQADKAFIDAHPSLKLIVRAGVGLDNVDLRYAEEQGITVRNTAGASSIAVAELVFALMLGLARDIQTHGQAYRSGGEAKKATGWELYGKTLGIVGVGNIGRLVAERAKAFGMEVIGHDPLISEASIPLLDLDEVVARSDIITLHLPLLPNTVGMFSFERIAAMRDGAVLINAARGGVIDDAAMVAAVESGKLRGIGADVYSAGGHPPTSMLALSNAVLTPHIGGATQEAQDRIGSELVRIIQEFQG